MAKKPLPKFDLISLGECLVELRREAAGQYSQSYAGDVFNTLYYASRLGLRTGFLSQFGADHFTDGLLALCAREYIDTSACKIHPVRPNGIYMIRTEQGEPSFSFWRKGSAATMTLAENNVGDLAAYARTSRNFLFSAIGLAVMQEIEKLYELLTLLTGKVKIHFDMNVRPSLWEDITVLKAHVERLALVVDVIFVSSTDDRHVFGERSSRDAVQWYADAGYTCVVYRDGANPTIGWTSGSGIVEVPTQPNVQVVDATGAGDAFNAGFIYCADTPFVDAIRFGNICGALAVRERGGQAASFSRAEVLRQF